MIWERLTKNHFSIPHLNTKTLNANTDNFMEFIACLKGNFIVIVLAESRYDETANENSSLNLENYYSVHQTRKYKKEVSFTFIYTNN